MSRILCAKVYLSGRDILCGRRPGDVTRCDLQTGSVLASEPIYSYRIYLIQVKLRFMQKAVKTKAILKAVGCYIQARRLPCFSMLAIFDAGDVIGFVPLSKNLSLARAYTEGMMAMRLFLCLTMKRSGYYAALSAWARKNRVFILSYKTFAL